MLDSEVFEQLQTASVAEKIQLIEAILQTLKHDLSEPSRLAVGHNRPLRSKVSHYENPYEPVATEDWKAVTAH